MTGRMLRQRLLSRLPGGHRLPGGGHRGYVGGRWDEIGKMQLDFMVSRGLKPESVFLDVACGSLRGGVHFIPYLDRGNYLGIDKEKFLIQRGLSQELPRGMREEKQPEFVVSDSFEFERFSKVPDMSLAQSLFTHLVVPDIELCLGKLRAFVHPGHEFYVTFLTGESDANPTESDPHKGFFYTPEQLAEFGGRHGWGANYIGDWEHPRGQLMMQYLAE
jgi:hypothetical protein